MNITTESYYTRQHAVVTGGGFGRVINIASTAFSAALAELVKNNPQGRLIKPAEVAEAVLWLCSPGTASITGQAISVAGGEV